MGRFSKIYDAAREDKLGRWHTTGDEWILAVRPCANWEWQGACIVWLDTVAADGEAAEKPFFAFFAECDAETGAYACELFEDATDSSVVKEVGFFASREEAEAAIVEILVDGDVELGD